MLGGEEAKGAVIPTYTILSATPIVFAEADLQNARMPTPLFVVFDRVNSLMRHAVEVATARSRRAYSHMRRIRMLARYTLGAGSNAVAQLCMVTCKMPSPCSRGGTCTMRARRQAPCGPAD